MDQGQKGKSAASQGEQQSLRLEVVNHTETQRGVILLPKRWVVERTFAWLARFRRLARDNERLATTLNGSHWLALVPIMLSRVHPHRAYQALGKRVPILANTQPVHACPILPLFPPAIPGILFLPFI